MKSQPTIATMKLLGGNPALDFVNTVDCRIGKWGPDLLADHDSLLLWAVRVGLIGDALAGRVRANEPAGQQSALQAAKTLREALYRLFLAEDGDAPVQAADLAVLDMWVARAMAERTLAVSNTGRIAWTFADSTDPGLVTRRVALAASELLLDPTRRPVRQCHGPDCGWLFLDTTRGGHRLWCSSAGCGTRVRVRRFREGL